ncbi:vanadium-dependent haloperoxidase [Gramella sp. MT6]|uniref:vanadium-dependent haloperoxidase n=1 Tax=Gramella sp. MT6 TaxID=2705471 RepID=UPI001C5FF262|nr:vanadium-dependent haloperoxidase [Gramella sp. MT6]QYA26133.1 vanadium-dependent haloperoxidase [Gramella sp. MT6]
MKTKNHLPLALCLLTFLCSCNKDELPSNEPDESSIQDLSFRNYNNGMIKSYNSETLISWNILLGSIVDEKMPPPPEAKIYAMVTIAMHDALNNVVPKYETYALDNTMVDASYVSKKNIQALADAAISQAARDVLVAMFPASATSADALLSDIYLSIEDEESKTKGMEIGKAAAAAILEKRQSDFPFIFTAYSAPDNEPGTYQADYPPYMFPNPPIWPANAVYTVNLGDLTPFGIKSSDQFLAGSPYTVDTQEYTDDYNEVKSLGCSNCPERTNEQTEIRDFWFEHTSSSINRIARDLIMREDLNGWQAARLIALLEMSQMDSYIASFEEKDFFKYWAPITAIRRGDSDGNSETVGDPGWATLRPTPPVYEFPSTMSYASAASAEILRLFFGTDDYSFTVSSPYYVPGVERTMKSFSQISHETGLSRIFLGHHFRHSVDAGESNGIELGNYIFENNLRELKKLK